MGTIIIFEVRACGSAAELLYSCSSSGSQRGLPFKGSFRVLQKQAESRGAPRLHSNFCELLCSSGSSYRELVLDRLLYALRHLIYKTTDHSLWLVSPGSQCECLGSGRLLLVSTWVNLMLVPDYLWPNIVTVVEEPKWWCYHHGGRAHLRALRGGIRFFIRDAESWPLGKRPW